MTDEELAHDATAGNRAALDELIARYQTRIYQLALRMLWHPADAEEATQEILIKLLTQLGSFSGESRLSTWIWRIAVNQLLDTRKRRAEQQALSFEDFATALQHNRSAALSLPDRVDEDLLAEEVKVGCMQGMLLCLSREERATYVLGELFGLPDREAAAIFEISPVAYHKRLSRARQALRSFLQQHCGLANPANPCRCRSQIKSALEQGRIDPQHLLFARDGEHPALLRGIAELDEFSRAAALFRSHPVSQVPERLRAVLSALLDSGQIAFLAPQRSLEQGLG